MNKNKIYSYIPYFHGFGRCFRFGQVTLMSTAEMLSKELKAQGKDRTAHIYLMVSGCLARFAGNENLLLEDITAELLCRYDDYLIESGRKLNTVSFHMRNLRAIYNKAVRRELIPPPSENLLAGVHTGVYKTPKRALSSEEMHALSELADNLLGSGVVETIVTV
ncbi:MAG: phage integrase SAM-like domain-containing protein, partial [Dysgonamonadaceae bacterium]|nr:phage integrase SAM-like domain-containing protein [Dysgonamonadaceae bacterium]